MKEPQKISPFQFNVDLEDFFREKCRTVQDGYDCAVCGEPIFLVPCELSVHIEGPLDCVPNPTEGGRPIRVIIPACFRCERIPESKGCLHWSNGGVADVQGRLSWRVKELPEDLRNSSGFSRELERIEHLRASAERARSGESHA